MAQKQSVRKEKTSFHPRNGTGSLDLRERNRVKKGKRKTATPEMDTNLIISRSETAISGQNRVTSFNSRPIPQLEGYFGLQSLDLRPNPCCCKGL